MVKKRSTHSPAVKITVFPPYTHTHTQLEREKVEGECVFNDYFHIVYPP
jgi:hypothetical protein